MRGKCALPPPYFDKSILIFGTSEQDFRLYSNRLSTRSCDLNGRFHSQRTGILAGTGTGHFPHTRCS